MNELKPEDVMRALELCKSCRDLQPCDVCPYFRTELGDDESCVNRMAQDALALLREKDAEIERLKAEIGRLGEQCRVLTLEYPKITRAEAITEFFERVCKEVEQTPNANEFFVNAWKEKFAEIAKEMKGETDEN